MRKYVNDLVSVIIPTYKRAEALGRAIRSVLYQTYDNIEILVVDDNEPNDENSKNVEKIINEINSKKVKLVRQKKHINGAAARNAGINAAKGEYITFLDDDDLYLPTKIEEQLNYLKKLDSKIGGVSAKKIFIEDGKINHVSEKWKFDSKQNYKVLSKQLNIQTCTLLLRRKCLDETGYFDENLKRHQEVQLNSFFTQKYGIKLLDKFLVIIDSTDVSNRPSYEKILNIKKDYLKSVNPIINRYNKLRQKEIVAHNMTEVAYIKFKEKNKILGLFELLKCFIYPSVLIGFIKRYLIKVRYKKINKWLSKEEIVDIYNFIKKCEEK